MNRSLNSMDRVYARSRKQYGASVRTLRGETVKSEGERRIADYFHDNRIKYRYEDQAKTSQSAFRAEISHPDFYLPEYDVYVEYWGMIDAGDTKDRKNYREVMNWKISRYNENGIKFLSLYPWSLNDLDGAFRTEFRKVLGRDLATGAVGEKSVFGLPIANDFEASFRSNVPHKLEISEFRLLYRPYYFIEYDCFTQGTLFYERINLDSRGTLVLEGERGTVVDMVLHSGTQPDLPQTGLFVKCAGIAQRETLRSHILEVASFTRLEAEPVRISGSEAEKIVKVEIAKNLSKTFTREHRKGPTTEKTLRPYESEVRIVSVKHLNIPIITCVYAYKDRTYSRTIQATTNRIISDDLAFCNMEERHPSEVIFMCEECGGLACKDYSKKCDVCGMHLCNEHATSKGMLLKKYYCSEHVPSK